MEDFKFIHLSDLHIFRGTSQRFNNHKHSTQHMKGVQMIIEKEKDNLDRLIISGDISHYGDEQNLLLAKQWIFGSIKSDEGQVLSMGLPKAQHNLIRLVPGNHDAWNSKTMFGRIIDKRQKSLENFNAIFGENGKHVISFPHGYYYDWLQKDNRAVFFVFLDSSFIGDTEIEKDNPELKYFDRIAKGKVSTKQAEGVLALYDQGMKGKLKNPHTDSYINSEIFSKALKVVVMHHYLFEPQGLKSEPLLQVKQTKKVFRNFAFADIDILMCGHKHYSESMAHLYINHFDHRAKARYIFNYFRRLIGIHSLPLQYVDDKGKKTDKFSSAIISILWSKYLSLNTNEFTLDMKFVDQLLHIFTKSIELPDLFVEEIKQFMGIYEATSAKENLIDEHELHEIATHLKLSLSNEERKKVKQVVKRLKKIVRKLSSRHFLQLMSGSACKAQDGENKLRSFNIYKIYSQKNGYSLLCEKYCWNPDLKLFDSKPSTTHYHFHDQNRPLH